MAVTLCSGGLGFLRRGRQPQRGRQPVILANVPENYKLHEN